MPIKHANRWAWQYCLSWSTITRPPAQDLISRLLERKPARRIGMLSGKAGDIKKHKWFSPIEWNALASKKVEPLRRPREADTAKRLVDVNRKYAVEKLPQLSKEEQYECDMVFKDF
jgi:cGMP-dependent protein kinase 2